MRRAEPPQARVTPTLVALSPIAATSASTAKKVTENVLAEYITELTEYIIHITCVTTSKPTGSRSKSLVTISVILRLFISVTQYLVSFRCLFELFFRFMISGVPVGVILHSHFAVSFFYLITTCRFANPKHLVIISFC